MGRNPCCSKDQGLNRGAWTFAEDKILTDYIKTHGEGRWRDLPQKAGLKRCGKSCRLRWLNYLRPDIKRGNISPDEEELIIRLHKLLGNRWSLIAGRLPGRTDNEIKNYWNTNLGKKVQLQRQQNTSNSSADNKQHKFTKMTHNPKAKTDPSSSGGSALPSNNKIATSVQVIRTKAVKCTSKVILNPEPHKTEKEYTVGGPSELEGDFYISNCLNPEIREPGHDTTLTNGLSSFDNQDVNDISAADFAGNLNLVDGNDELCLADLLNSDYQISDFLPEYNGMTAFKDVQSSSANDLLFSEEMLVQDWNAEPNVGSEFNSFSSALLDGSTEEDWLAD